MITRDIENEEYNNDDNDDKSSVMAYMTDLTVSLVTLKNKTRGSQLLAEVLKGIERY